MTYVASARGGTTAGSSTTITITVPAGVTTAHTGLLCLAGSNPTMPTSFTVSGGGVTQATVFAPATATNMWFAAYRIKNVAAGQVLTIVGTASNLFVGALHFFTEDYTVGTRGDRGGVSQAFVNVPSMAVANGARCWVVASDRSASSTSVSVSNPSGTVTQKFYDDGNVTNEGVCSHYLGEFVATSAASNQSVATWNASNANAIGFHITETATPGRPKVWTGSAWVSKPAKVWSGSAWVTKPVKVWTGSSWKTVS